MRRGPIPAWAGETLSSLHGAPEVRAHPRVGGGDDRDACLGVYFVGPSPRGRGRPHRSDARGRVMRPIPAWAGETSRPSPSARVNRAHPRVGGGDRRASIRRGRGLGPIPAWAGETPARACRRSGWWAHPRVGGGDSTRSCCSQPQAGPSPRGRGRRRVRQRRQILRGPIPAWAGETRPAHQNASASGAHPRVGGGDEVSGRDRVPVPGPSPRGRGRPGDGEGRAAAGGPIPAWAGETTGARGGCRLRGAHPRVGGGDENKDLLGAAKEGPSPRGRGRLVEVDGERRGEGPIPAWAGETFSRSTFAATRRAHPRVGGGDGHTQWNGI